jgi:hypothetical protein
MKCPSSGKEIHWSYGEAMAHLRSLRERTEYQYQGEVYPCDGCGGWHVGRLKRSAHRNKYKRK